MRRTVSTLWVLGILSLNAIFTLEAKAEPGHPDPSTHHVLVPGDWAAWTTAKNFYDSQRYPEALKAFQDHPIEGAAYHYNLGLVYFRLGQLGAARAHLEKANRLHPHDPDIQHNLSLVHNTLARTLGPERLDSTSTWVEQIADRLSLDEVRMAIGVLGLALISVWIKTYSSSRKLKYALLKPSAVLTLTGLLATSGVYLIQRWGNAYPPAISLQRQAVRSGPGEHYMELAEAAEGSKLRILGPVASASGKPDEVWQQVRFSQEGIGWVKALNLLAL